MEIVLSTRNPSKIEQIRSLLFGLDVTILSLDDVGVVGDVIEDGQTLEENATKKARYAQSRVPHWAIADDTGLFIDALGGKPGIHAARWAGEDLSTEERMRFALRQMSDIP